MKKIWKNGNDVKLNPKTNPDEMKFEYLPRTITGNKIKYYTGKKCILCSGDIPKNSNTLMMRLFNPSKRCWCAYNVHVNCFREYSTMMDVVYEKYKKDNEYKTKEFIDFLLSDEFKELEKKSREKSQVI